MPWKITAKAKGCNGFAVVKEGSNVPIPGGCHKTRQEAIKHLIAVRVGYGEREQPRDPDGKFASTGGSKDRPSKGRPIGGAKPDDIGVGKTITKPMGNRGKVLTLNNGKTVKIASKMKEAPKNVTSKGVNPDAQYVQSAKTGNIFINPQWNGNDAGAGKVALNGKDKFGGPHTSMALFPNQVFESSAPPASMGKFYETGQNKHIPPTFTTGAKLDAGVPIVGKKLVGGTSDKPSSIPTMGKPAKGAPQIKISKAPPPTIKQQEDFKGKLEKQLKAQKDEELALGQTSTHKKVTSKNNLTSQEQQAITSYTGNGYHNMNDTLRDSHGTSMGPKIKMAQNGLMKHSLEEDVVLSRRMDIKSESVGKLQPGDEIYDPAFQSTSTSGGWHGNAQMRIYAPKGTKGMSVQSFSQHSSEMEVLLPAGATYRVMSISTKTNSYGGIQALIDVEIVDQGIRPGVAPTLEGKARKDIIEIEKFTTDLRKCAINGVFPDGFRLTA